MISTEALHERKDLGLHRTIENTKSTKNTAKQTSYLNLPTWKHFINNFAPTKKTRSTCQLTEIKPTLQKRWLLHTVQMLHLKELQEFKLSVEPERVELEGNS